MTIKQSKHIFLAIFTSILTLLSSFHAHAEEDKTSQIYETFQPAEKVMPSISQMLKDDEQANFKGNSIFVTASSQTHQNIQTFLDTYDQLPRNMVITVQFSNKSYLKEKKNKDSLAVQTDNGSIIIGGKDNPKQKDGSTVIYRGSSKDNKVTVGVERRQERISTKGSVTQSIQGMEGERASIYFGQEVPFRNYYFLNSSSSNQTNFYSSKTGFEVEASSVKDRIRVNIYAQKNQFKDKQKGSNIAEANASFWLKPGEWTTIGQSSTNSSQSSTTISTKNLSNSNQNGFINMRIDFVN